MRIYGTNGANALAASPTAKRSAAGTFSLDSGTAARGAAATGAPRLIGGIDALIALQGFEEPGERRRRAVKRGRAALDALDALKLALLAGSLDTAALSRLKSAAGDLAERSGEPELDNVLAEIELRTQVELAKFGMPQSGKSPA
jgi:hypothetical protein